MRKNSIFMVLLIMLGSISVNATDVEVYFNRKHLVGSVDNFQRSKFVTIHSANYEGLKSGGNALMDYIIDDLEVYYGRETGNISNIAKTYPSGASTACATFKNSYKTNTRAHGLESSQKLTVSGQYSIYDGFVTAASDDYALAGKNYGDLLSIFLDEGCGTGGTDGMPAPNFLEILNEPLWDPIDQYVLWKTTDPLKPTQAEEIDILNELFLFHRESAREVHRQFPDAKIGGFAEAFPDPESRDFFNWDTRWKTFIDTCGADMDYYSFHLYDFNEPTDKFRKGGNMEAFMDLLSHYNYITWGEEKPFLVTEFGARTRNIEDQKRNPERDWKCSSSISSMMMQFMDRPDMMEGVTPFIMAVWSTDWNIFNPDNNTAEFTDYVKMYELWAGVKGTRLVTNSSDLDLQVDAYVNGNKTYLVLNNLESNSITVDVSEMGIDESNISSTMTKHLYWNSTEVRLDTINFSGAPTTLTVNSMATMVVEYTTASAIAIDTTIKETRNYATTYKQAITANTPISFSINNLELTDDGNATLKVGVGRAHGLSLKPTVKVNGTEVTVPTDLRGDAQANKSSFFGMIEIDVPHNLLQKDNTVTVEFSDAGGFVTSMVLRLFSIEAGNISSVNDKEGCINPNLNTELKIYPNPATSQLFVDAGCDADVEYSIYSIEGRLIANAMLMGDYINISTLDIGTYILKTDIDGKVYINRFVKSE